MQAVARLVDLTGSSGFLGGERQPWCALAPLRVYKIQSARPQRHTPREADALVRLCSLPGHAVSLVILATGSMHSH